jgi:hypothetical protein
MKPSGKREIAKKKLPASPIRLIPVKKAEKQVNMKTAARMNC